MIYRREAERYEEEAISSRPTERKELRNERAYSREQLPSGCILYKLTAKQENYFCEPEK